MLEMVQRAIRGGLCVAPLRHARANNSQVSDYDAALPTTHLMLIDANSHADRRQLALSYRNVGAAAHGRLCVA